MVKCQLGSGGARIQVVNGLALSPGVFSASRASPEKREVCSNLNPWIFISPTLLLKSCAAILPACVQESSKQEGTLARASWWETPSLFAAQSWSQAFPGPALGTGINSAH